MLQLKTLFATSLISLSFPAFSAHPLMEYYKGEINLSEQRIQTLIEETLDESPSNFLVAYAYYLKAIRHKRSNAAFDAFEAYDRTIQYLAKSKMTSNYLQFSARRNQGVILKQHWLLQDAIKKYEEALPYAYDYNTDDALSVKYNLGRALALSNPEKALEVFFEILGEAEEEKLPDRQVKVSNEIGLMLVRSGEYDHALEYLEKALNSSNTDVTRSITFQNLAHLYQEKEDYIRQEEWLLKSLSVRKGADRFISLMDLGHCLLLKNEIERADSILLKALTHYKTQPLRMDNIQVFKWLSYTNPDAINYLKKYVSELESIITAKENLEKLLKQQAMQEMLLRMEAEKEKKEKVNFYKAWALTGGIAILLLLIVWKLWWSGMRRSVSHEVSQLLDKE
ncbi:MAG: hypothetical protein RIM99_05285 [Cyclobacteriaceae bacterium]